MWFVFQLKVFYTFEFFLTQSNTIQCDLGQLSGLSYYHITTPHHHTTSPHNITTPHHHSTSPLHITTPHHHTTSPLHITTPHHITSNSTPPPPRCNLLNIGDQIFSIDGASLVGLPLSTCQNHIKVLSARWPSHLILLATLTFFVSGPILCLTIFCVWIFFCVFAVLLCALYIVVVVVVLCYV